MALLTLSAVDKAIKDPSSWREPVLYKALLVTGLSVLIASNDLLRKDLKTY